MVRSVVLAPSGEDAHSGWTRSVRRRRTLPSAEAISLTTSRIWLSSDFSIDSAMSNARVKGWRIYEVPCGHYVMLDMPERLAAILQETL
jgi:hypothetical protein